MAISDLTFCETDAATIKAAVISEYEEIADRTLAPGDPIRLFLESVAAIIVQQRELIDFAAKQNLLSFASGTYLDALGELLGVTRLEAGSAITTLRFTLSEALDFAVTIPAGTRATPDGSLYFATDEAAVVAIGETYIDVGATCVETGETGNGYAIGQINQIVDPVAYVESVSNTTETSGGSDEEDDEALRERIRLAPESFSVAGPSGAYEYWAKTASSAISDVAVVAPEDEPGHVYIYPLLEGGELPTDDILELVYDVLSAENIRPITDTVHVESPEAVDYTVDITYYIATDDETNATTIQADVETAVEDYITWQKTVIGRDIIPSELIRAVMAAGALRVEVTSPEHTVLDATQLAVCTSSTVTFGGLEDG